MEQLVVRVGAHDKAPVQWVVYDSSQDEVRASGELPDAAALASLPERTGQHSAIVLAPASDILLTWVTLPPRAGRKIISAIPFMLEDELAADISEQFFALGPRVENEQAVAVVRRELLDTWQRWLADAGLYCDTLLPDVLAVPSTPEGWSLLAVNDEWLLRNAQWQGLQGESSWIKPAFAHLTKQHNEPVLVTTYTEADTSELPNIELASAPLELPMQVLAREAVKREHNLLQGEYKVKRQRTGALRQWRLAAGLAALVLITALVEKSVTLYQLEQQNAALSARIDAAVKQGFPDLGAYRDVRRTISAQLRQMQQTGGGTSMLVMLDQLRPAFSGAQVRPQTLRFDANRTEIRLQAVAQNFAALEQFRREAEQAGFSVEQGAINNRDETVIGNVIIRSQS